MLLFNFYLFLLFIYILIYSNNPSSVHSALIIMKCSLVLQCTSSPAAELVSYIVCLFLINVSLLLVFVLRCLCICPTCLRYSIQAADLFWLMRQLFAVFDTWILSAHILLIQSSHGFTHSWCIFLVCAQFCPSTLNISQTVFLNLLHLL